LLDRIDLHIEVPAVPFNELSAAADGTDSRSMREQVVQARTIQAERFASSATRVNAKMTTRELRQLCPLDAMSRKMLEESVDQLGLSARAHDKVIRLARTIADIDGAEAISAEYVSEAVNYRMLDRKFWT
jgi:magnesium chelatase family protein